MKNNKLAIFNVVLFVFLFGLIIYREFLENPVETEVEITKPVTHEIGSMAELVPNSIKMPDLTPIPKSKQQRNYIVPKESATSRRAVDEFKKVALIDFSTPSGHDFVTIDFDEEIAGIYGATMNGDKEFVALAAPHEISLKEALKYVDEVKDGFPLIKDVKFSAGKVIEIETMKDSNLQNLKIISAKKPNKKDTVYLALTQRKDKKGSYLFMMRAPTSYYDNNEDGLDMLLYQLKARQ